MSEKRCWDVIVDGLGNEGVDYVFGLPGHPDALYDSLYDSEVEPVLVRHESSGVFMAMAYAKLKRRPGVCFASPGPGVSNLVPGVLEAWSGCTPVLALGGSASLEHEGEGVFQEAPQMEIMRSITKWSFRIPHADRAAWATRRAFNLATNGKPGPIYLEVPFDVGQQKTQLTKYKKSIAFTRSRPDYDLVKRVTELLLNSERPVIVAGGGAHTSNASGELIEFAELLGIPVLTTPSGRGVFPENHPLSVGQVGLYRTRIGREAYQKADLIVSLGSRNEEFQTAAWRYYPDHAALIQVDIDSSELARNFDPTVALVADVKLFLRDIITEIKGKVKRTPLHDIPRAKSIIEASTAFRNEVEAECRTSLLPLKSKRVIYDACRVFGPRTVLVNENGSQDLWSYYWPYWEAGLDGCVAPAEQTCMGLAVAGCIGAKLATPDRPVVCTTGDGAFQMFMKEMPTAVQYKAPVTWIVLNTDSLGWIKLHERANKGRYIAVDFTAQPDFVKVADASGCYGEKVTDPGDILPALARALKENERGIPAMLEFKVDPWDFADGFREFQPNLFK
ncbi:MAG: thiamine pyrophosphate-binding protein [Candidatus Bathyarchaeota archaeon]|nr:thiamine pyrophosphate-binding protein [Candidatus Bathyarchaeota archaeon]